jgi:hypothetical protein
MCRAGAVGECRKRHADNARAGDLWSAIYVALSASTEHQHRGTSPCRFETTQNGMSIASSC